MHDVPFTPATDPLGHTAPLDQRASFLLLGVPLEVRSNSPAVIGAAERAFGGWRGLEPELIEDCEPCVVNLIVHDDRRPTTDDRRPTNGDENGEARTAEPRPAEPSTETRDPQNREPRTESQDYGLRATDYELRTETVTRSTPFIMRFHSDCFLGTDGANLLTAQLDRGFALGFVTPELVADESRLRYHALELLALALVSRRDRVPVHAGAIVRRGRAVLLAGRSTAGKSTLCYACLREDFQLLTEDVVYVSLRHGLRLWGVPWQIHLLPDAVRHFGELVDIPSVLQANGKRKLTVEIAAFGMDRARRHVERAAVCVVERASGAASALEPIEPCAAIEVLSGDLESGFDLHGETIACAEALVAGGAYRLRVGSDLAGAVALLRELTE
ncbi:MAG TPA: hypothetical protein VFO07_12185 [Roseiflexaceae bacterium]|nr:hypothetical protein [Roseiflexaceae bacterium]